ncbi:hypothetical protein [Serratia bockelmannii]|uniref:hypothetical protein n=1 Tax=Serratia bockelmannii TaxID=2703793 RepID=UPI003C2F3A72
MDKFREPEQFDAEVEIHGGEPFAVWAPAVNGSHVKAELYYALLAVLEAKDERIGELEAIATDYAGKFQKAQDANKHLIIMSNDDKKRIAELEAEGKVWASAATKHLARAEEAEQRVAELSELETHNQCLIKKNADLTQQNIKLGERLATPVRLPGFHKDADGNVWLNPVQVVKEIRRSGFTVEGDE